MYVPVPTEESSCDSSPPHSSAGGGGGGAARRRRARGRASGNKLSPKCWRSVC
jgi:hypothetical protein